MDHLLTTWSVFQALVLEAVPFLLIGILISSLARHLLPGGMVLRRLPDHPLLGPLTGAAMGFALPACECGNVPVARRLLAAGTPLATALGFLFAAPVLNPIVLAGTWAAFPDRPWLLAARPLGALVLALALAVLLRLLPERELLARPLFTERSFHRPLSQGSLLERPAGLIGVAAAAPGKEKGLARGSVPGGSATGSGTAFDPPGSAAAPALGSGGGRATPGPRSGRQPWQLSLNHGIDEFLELGALLVLGCLIAAAIQTLLPRAWLLALGQAPTLSILALMLLAVIISVCSSVDAFLALGFAAQVTPGALLAFLLLGPIVDIKAIGLYRAVFRGPALAGVCVAAALLVLLLGQWVNLVAL